jgi:hypothetical protein
LIFADVKFFLTQDDMIFRNAFGCNTATYGLILLPVKGDLERAAELDYVSHKRSTNKDE